MRRISSRYNNCRVLTGREGCCVANYSGHQDQSLVVLLSLSYRQGGGGGGGPATPYGEMNCVWSELRGCLVYVC